MYLQIPSETFESLCIRNSGCCVLSLLSWLGFREQNSGCPLQWSMLDNNGETTLFDNVIVHITIYRKYYSNQMALYMLIISNMTNMDQSCQRLKVHQLIKVSWSLGARQKVMCVP